MEKTIFKKGDKVYSNLFGWCEVLKADKDSVSVISEEKIHNVSNHNLSMVFAEKTFSFTEYTLNNFSQERPIDYSEWVGKWCKFWDKSYDFFCVDKLTNYKENKSYKFETNSSIYNYAELLTEEQVKILELETK